MEPSYFSFQSFSLRFCLLTSLEAYMMLYSSHHKLKYPQEPCTLLHLPYYWILSNPTTPQSADNATVIHIISLGTGFTFLSSHSLLGLEPSTAEDVAPLHSCLFPTFLSFPTFHFSFSSNQSHYPRTKCPTSTVIWPSLLVELFSPFPRDSRSL